MSSLLPRVPLSIVACALTAWSACGPPWTVLKESGPPSALAGKASVSVAFDRAEAMVGRKTLAEYAAENEQKEGKLTEWLDEMDQTFAAALTKQVVPATVTAGPAAADGAALTVKYTWLQVGYYATIASQASVLRVKLEWRVGGELTDAIEYETTLQASMTRASAKKRLLWCAEEAGSLAAKFLQDKRVVAAQ